MLTPTHSQSLGLMNNLKNPIASIVSNRDFNFLIFLKYAHFVYIDYFPDSS